MTEALTDSATQSSARSPSLRRLRFVVIPMFVLAATAWTTVAQDDSGRSTTRSYGRGEPNVINGKTEPSKEVELAFANLGKINQVLVKEGDQIEAGQILMRQEDAADVARLKALEVEADVQARVNLARTQADLARLELTAAEQAFTAAKPLEVERAKAEVQLADTRIIIEQQTGLVAGHRADEQRILVDQKVLSSPETGVVQAIDAAVGEVFGPQTPALRVVKIDPLFVEVLLGSAAQVMKLRVGQTVQVRYEGEQDWHDAKVVFINPVGDPAGGTSRLPFRAELPNPEGRPAGLNVEVRLPEAAPPTADAGSSP